VQCTIIRTTELAAAQDQLTDLERQKDDIMRSYSPAALLDKLQSKYLEEYYRQFLYYE
jgi:ESCRT-I complex subunit VPS37